MALISLVALSTISIPQRTETSANPNRDQVVGGVAHLAILESIGAVLPKPLPAYAAVVGAEAIARAAHLAQSTTQNFLNANSREDFVLPPTIEGECPNLYDIARVANMALTGAQLPAKGIHSTHHHLTESAGAALDAMGVTDASMTQGLELLGKYSPPMGVIP